MKTKLISLLCIALLFSCKEKSTGIQLIEGADYTVTEVEKGPKKPKLEEWSTPNWISDTIINFELKTEVPAADIGYSMNFINDSMGTFVEHGLECIVGGTRNYLINNFVWKDSLNYCRVEYLTNNQVRKVSQLYEVMEKTNNKMQLRMVETNYQYLSFVEQFIEELANQNLLDRSMYLEAYFHKFYLGELEEISMYLNLDWSSFEGGWLDTVWSDTLKPKHVVFDSIYQNPDLAFLNSQIELPKNDLDLDNSQWSELKENCRESQAEWLQPWIHGFASERTGMWYRISMPIYTQDKKHVIMKVSDLCEGLCGTGGYYYYRKDDNGQWYETSLQRWWH